MGLVKTLLNILQPTRNQKQKPGENSDLVRVCTQNIIEVSDDNVLRLIPSGHDLWASSGTADKCDRQDNSVLSTRAIIKVSSPAQAMISTKTLKSCLKPKSPVASEMAGIIPLTINEDFDHSNFGIRSRTSKAARSRGMQSMENLAESRKMRRRNSDRIPNDNDPFQPIGNGVGWRPIRKYADIRFDEIVKVVLTHGSSEYDRTPIVVDHSKDMMEVYRELMIYKLCEMPVNENSLENTNQHLSKLPPAVKAKMTNVLRSILIEYSR